MGTDTSPFPAAALLAPEEALLTLPGPRELESRPPPASGVGRVLLERSWGALYEEHADFVWRCLRRMGVSADEARDALHDVFLVVHRRLHTFDENLGTERSWLFGIAANVVRGDRRKRRPVPMERLDSLQQPGTPDARSSASCSHRVPSGEQAAMAGVLRRTLVAAIADLDPERRAVFTMFEIEGLGCAEIAAELDVPVGTVYSRLHTARKTLQESLAAYRPDAEGRER